MDFITFNFPLVLIYVIQASQTGSHCVTVQTARSVDVSLYSSCVKVHYNNPIYVYIYIVYIYTLYD